MTAATRRRCSDIPDLEVLRLAARWEADVAAGFDPRWREVGPPQDPRPVLVGPPVPAVDDALGQHYPPRLAAAKLARLIRRGLLEERGAAVWLTERGRAVLLSAPPEVP